MLFHKLTCKAMTIQKFTYLWSISRNFSLEDNIKKNELKKPKKIKKKKKKKKLQDLEKNLRLFHNSLEIKKKKKKKKKINQEEETIAQTKPDLEEQKKRI
jgi:hypothetical protein